MTATPRTWIDGPLRTHTGCVPAAPARWVTLAELVDDPALLELLHARLVQERAATPQAAAKWVLGWSAGSLAGAVGFGLADARSGLVVRPDALRWGVHDGGWFDRVDVGEPTVVVAAGHAWAGAPGVVVLGTHEEVRARAVHELAAVLAPLVDRVRRLARVGATTLWAEVGDGLGLALLHRTDVPATEAAAVELRAAVAVPGAPWRQRPHLELVEVAGGPALVGQKSGCCLAFQCPPPGGAPEYCSTCSLLPTAECTAVQLAALRVQRGLVDEGSADRVR